MLIRIRITSLIKNSTTVLMVILAIVDIFTSNFVTPVPTTTIYLEYIAFPQCFGKQQGNYWLDMFANGQSIAYALTKTK